MSSKKRKAAAVVPAEKPTMTEGLEVPAAPAPPPDPSGEEEIAQEFDSESAEVDSEPVTEAAPEPPAEKTVGHIIFRVRPDEKPIDTGMKLEVPVPADLVVPEGQSVVASFAAPDGSRVFKLSGNKKLILPPA